jgi:ABC-type branched-subunit amino acid transport system ATPase component/ABC-type branched-subunit amino acid transport system permease subunit
VNRSKTQPRVGEPRFAKLVATFDRDIQRVVDRCRRIPAASNRLVNYAVWVMAVTGIVVFGLLPYLFGSGTVLTAGDALTIGLFAMSINLLVGTTGLVTFGQAAFYGIGAFTTVIFTDVHGWPPLAALALAPVTAGAAAFLSGFIVLRGRELYFGLLTLGVGQLLWAIAHGWASVTGGDNGLTYLTANPYPAFVKTINDAYWFTYVVVLLAVIALYVITRSPFGDALRGIRENRRRAEFTGLWVKRYEMTALTVAGAFAGIAGGLFAMFESHASQDQLYWTTSAQGLIACLIGGIGSFLGPMAGGFFYWFLQDYLVSKTTLWNLVIGVAVLLVALVMPGGLTGALRFMAATILAPVERAFRRGPAQPSIPEAPAEDHEEVVHLPDMAAIGEPEHRGRRVRPTTNGGPPILEVKGLSKRFGGLVAVDDVSFEVLPGTVHAIIGPNGAGKTTLFNLITGLISPDRGSVVFEGQDITHFAPWRLVKRGLGRSFQQTNLFWALSSFHNTLLAAASVKDATRKMWGSHRKDLREGALQQLSHVGLEDLAEIPAAELSHGDQRSLELAAALGVDARLILLDEFTAGLSPSETRAAVALVERIARARDLTVLFIEHDMAVVFGFAEHITVLHRGRVLADGSPAEIRANRDVQLAYLSETEDAH